MYVGLCFELLNYDAIYPNYNWIFNKFANMYEKNKCFFVIGQEGCFPKNYQEYCEQFKDNARYMNYDIPKEKTLTKLKKYMITYEETKKILSYYNDDRYLTAEKLIEESNDYAEQVIENKLDLIEKDTGEKITCVIVWVNSKTLVNVSKRRNFKILNLELSTFRPSAYRQTLGYFCFDNKFSKTELKNEYEKYLESDDNTRIFSRKELISMLVSRDYLKQTFNYDNMCEYDLGISPGLKKHFFFDIYSNEKIEKTIKKAEKLFSDCKVSVRFHPAYHWDLKTSFDIDDSPSSIDWVLKCRRIVTSISNVSFEAMLYGRTVYILSDSMPFSFITNNSLDFIDDELVSLKFLNFVIFGYYVPWNLMFDLDYIKWRVSNPSIIDIYNRNFSEVLKIANINKNDNLRTILKKVQNMTDCEIDNLLNNNSYNEREMIKESNNNLKENINHLYKDMISYKEQSEFYKNEFEKVINSKGWKLLNKFRNIKK